MNIPITEIKNHSLVGVRLGNCPHHNVETRYLYGVLWSGERSAETVDEKLYCLDCKSTILTLSEERNPYEY